MKPLCSYCNAVPVGDGAMLCAGCTQQVRDRLDDAAAFAAELDVTLSRQTSGSRVGGRSSERPVPYDVGASTAAEHLRGVLVAWVRLVMEERPPCRHMGPHPRSGCTRCPAWPADAPAAMARWLRGWVPWLRMHPAAAEFVAEMDDAVTKARWAVDSARDRVFVGVCCSARVYAPPNRSATACPVCGAVFDVAAERAALADKLVDQLAHAEVIGRALANLGVEVTPDAIRKWSERGRLAAHGTDEKGRPQYRVGDVIDLAAQAAQRRERRAGSGERMGA